MKTVKKTLRYWFLGASLVTFLGGWLMLAHAPKPVQPAQNTGFSLASFLGLPSLRSFDEESRPRNGLNLVTRRSNLNSGFPILRTGGS